VNIEDDRLTAINVNGRWEPCQALILALGHSASDTLRQLHEDGIHMESKPFQVGVRIEHPQRFINEAMLHDFKDDPRLIHARYTLTAMADNGKGIYTFCMCPGCTVVAAASEEGGLCVNGMSNYARDGANCNSALLVSVEPGYLPGTDVLAGVELQRQVEQAAFRLGRAATGLPFAAPVQTVQDFLADRRGATSTWVAPSYPRAVAWENLAQCLPPFIVDALREALPLMNGKLAGFANPQAVLTGVETRSSSPVRILRGNHKVDLFRILIPCPLCR